MMHKCNGNEYPKYFINMNLGLLKLNITSIFVLCCCLVYIHPQCFLFKYIYVSVVLPCLGYFGFKKNQCQTFMKSYMFLL